MWRGRLVPFAAATTSLCSFAQMQESHPQQNQPTAPFNAPKAPAVPSSNNKKIFAYSPPRRPVLDSEEDPEVSIISGSSNRALSEKIAKELGRKLSNVEIKHFSDGEISIVINESMRGKDVFILQSCAPAVNDSVMELLLAVAAARRCGAMTVTAVIPFFGYRLNRRGLPISTTHHSRFLWSAATDLAKMLLVMGVDKVISVDLQRPGQGHEACFFHTSLPAETITTHDLFVQHFHKILPLSSADKLAIVSPNVEFVKKAKKFQSKLSQLRPDQEIDCAVFLRSDSDLSFTKGAALELQGDVRGKDVILIEDYIDSAVHISNLCNRLMKEGAQRVYVCASHAFLDENAMQLVELSPLTEVVVSDSIALPKTASGKIVQLTIAPLLAKVIASDASYGEDEFNPDEEEDQFVPE